MLGNNKYKLKENNDESVALKEFSWKIDDKNNAVISWLWPNDRTIKLALVFEMGLDETAEDFDDISKLLKDEYPHEVVVRDLASNFTANIEEGRRKYLVCPGFFDDSQTVVLYKPVYVTDWIYKKAVVTAHVSYKPIFLSKYQKVSLRILSTDATLMNTISKVLTYTINEHGRNIGEYPLDLNIMNGNGHFYIKKDQKINFMLDERYTHLLELQ